MGDMQIGKQGEESAQAAQAALNAPSIAPVSITISQGDTVESVKGKLQKKGITASSPELAVAMYMMSLADKKQIILQNLETADLVTIRVDNYQPMNIDAILLKIENAQSEICIKVLTAWNESIKEEAARIRKEMKSDQYRAWQEAHGGAGYEKWLHSLSPEQRFQVLEYPYLHKLEKIDTGIALGLGSYLDKLNASPDAVEKNNAKIITETVVAGGPLRYEYAAYPDTVSTSQVSVNPLKEATTEVFLQIGPQSAAAQGYLASMFVAGTMFSAAKSLVLHEGMVLDKKNLNYQWAKTNAEQTLNVVNGSEFNTIAGAIVSAHVDGGEGLSEERVEELVKMVKVVILSAAVAMLYRMENAYKGNASRMTGQEFDDLVEGKMTLAEDDIKTRFAVQIKDLLGGLPSQEAMKMKGLMMAYVDTNPDVENMLDVDKIFASLKEQVVSESGPV